MNTQVYITEFKKRFRIFNTSEDEEIGQQLEDSYQDIQSLIGLFDPKKYRKGKELVFERTRYLRNEALEYFYGNFQTMIMDASIDLAGEKFVNPS
ncbi:phage gp6-like head-tail connector protein [Enterococcus sp. DIV1420a]|uniref:phage gp6-like head-tail connector protein n=1 Tax=Enterococcus sp. DIV1420a TaxID=2774672 RepID=UPI003F28E8DD